MKETTLFKVLEFASKETEFFVEDVVIYVKKDNWEKAVAYLNSMTAPAGTDLGPQSFLQSRHKYELSNGETVYHDRRASVEYEERYELKSIGTVYTISPIGMATYLEMLELHEAREASAQAHLLARRAIWISIALGSISAVIGVCQIMIGLQQTADTYFCRLIFSLFP